MSEQTYTYRDSTFNPDQAYYYDLLLLVEANSFSYAISYNKQMLVYNANCLLSELTDPEQFQEILSAKYKKTIIALPSTGFSLVPSSLFDESRIADFSHLLDVKNNEKVLAQVLDSKNHIVYKVNEQLLAAVNQLENKNIVFAAKGWINAIVQNNSLNDQLFVNVGSKKIELLYFKEAAIRFYNAFEYNNEDDVTYYTALVAKELDLQPESTSIVISGNINIDDQYCVKLSEFFGEILLNAIKPLELPAEISSHQILSLAALTLCESSEVL
jgi:hypothetical protein